MSPQIATFIENMNQQPLWLSLPIGFAILIASLYASLFVGFLAFYALRAIWEGILEAIIQRRWKR